MKYKVKVRKEMLVLMTFEVDADSEDDALDKVDYENDEPTSEIIMSEDFDDDNVVVEKEEEDDI